VSALARPQAIADIRIAANSPSSNASARSHRHPKSLRRTQVRRNPLVIHRLVK
jgi:hypothetical protein